MSATQHEGLLFVSHRAEILLGMQYKKVKNLQEALQTELEVVFNTFNNDNMDAMTITHSKEGSSNLDHITSLKDKLDAVLIRYKVGAKIYKEMAYAKQQLEQAVKYNKGVKESQIRFNWLEGRLEKVLQNNERPRAHNRRIQKSDNKHIISMLDYELSRNNIRTANSTQYSIINKESETTLQCYDKNPSESTLTSKPVAYIQEEHSVVEKPYSRSSSISKTPNTNTNTYAVSEVSSKYLQKSQHTPGESSSNLESLKPSSIFSNMAISPDNGSDSNYNSSNTSITEGSEVCIHDNVVTNMALGHTSPTYYTSEQWNSESEANWTLQTSTDIPNKSGMYNPMKLANRTTATQPLSTINHPIISVNSPDEQDEAENDGISLINEILDNTVDDNTSLVHRSESMSNYNIDIVRKFANRKVHLDSPPIIADYTPHSWNSIRLAKQCSVQNLIKTAKSETIVRADHNPILKWMPGTITAMTNLHHSIELANRGDRPVTLPYIAFNNNNNNNSINNNNNNNNNNTKLVIRTDSLPTIITRNISSNKITIETPQGEQYQDITNTAPYYSRPLIGKYSEGKCYPKPIDIWLYGEKLQSVKSIVKDMTSYDLQNQQVSRLSNISTMCKLNYSKLSKSTDSCHYEDLASIRDDNTAFLCMQVFCYSQPHTQISALQHIARLKPLNHDVIINVKLVYDALTSTPIVKYEAMKVLAIYGEYDVSVVNYIIETLYINNEHVIKDLLIALRASPQPEFDNLEQEVERLADRLIDISNRTSDHAPCTKLHATRLLVYYKLSLDDSIHMLMQYLNIEELYKYRLLIVTSLIEDCEYFTDEVTDIILQQLETDPCESNRIKYARFLKQTHNNNHASTSKLVPNLTKALWDDSSKLVRVEVGRVFYSLGLAKSVIAEVYKQLEEDNAQLRLNAVKSLGSLNIATAKCVKLLLETLEIDPSIHVKIEVIKTLSAIQKYNKDKRIVKVLTEKAKGEGLEGLEARKVLDTMNELY